VTVEGEEFQWYRPAALPPPAAADRCGLLVIDGPPARLGSLMRYPALPLLHRRLAGDAVVVLDDANRDDEREILRRWGERYPEFDIELLRHEKGTAVLYRRPSVTEPTATAPQGAR
jgi:hypothetical protein